jgi:biotin carboxyl carrier protein
LEESWIPFATASGVTLRYPSARVERVGFHQANHEGAQQIDPLPDAVNPVTMEARDRLTGDRTAADVVSDPDLEVRAPVSGRVIAANAYTLYCKYRDELVFIDPDDHPGWEVKVLHIVGVQVAPGDHVVAGETVIALHPHQLPFTSDVDNYRTVDPAWPHVHLEVIDLSIPDIPNPGSGC